MASFVDRVRVGSTLMAVNNHMHTSMLVAKIPLYLELSSLYNSEGSGPNVYLWCSARVANSSLGMLLPWVRVTFASFYFVALVCT